MKENAASKEAVWNILNDLLGNLTSKGIHVPTSVNKNLRHARFLLMVIKAHPKTKLHETVEIQREVDITLNGVRNKLLALVQDNLGPNHYHIWRESLNKAFETGVSVPTNVKKESLASGAFPKKEGIGHVRITLAGAVSMDWIQEIAKHCGVIITFEKSNVLRIVGRKESVRTALDEVAQIYRSYKV